MKTRERIEFGDFQTPPELAGLVCQVVASRGIEPATIVEPTCGIGTFLLAGLERFSTVTAVFGLEAKATYLEQARQRLRRQQPALKADLCHGDFFRFDWPEALRTLPEPILVIGNPPWVTSAGLGGVDSKNLPEKSNFQNHRGLDAITGKGNFDIAEWMVIRLLELLRSRQAVVAMLVKTSVARKVLVHAWKGGLPMTGAAMLTFDAKQHFGVNADACLLVCDMRPGPSTSQCVVSELSSPDRTLQVISYREGILIADTTAFERWRHLLQAPSAAPPYRWRSGVKHDCASVMELKKEGPSYTNVLREPVDIEEDRLFPLIKGADLANARLVSPSRWFILTQSEVGQDTRHLAKSAPRTWQYLCAHGDSLDNRRSSIYRKQPRFAIFGIGPYTFAPWKVAICGLYKRLKFAVVGGYEGKPCLLDDTCYHLACRSREEAELLASFLNSETAGRFFSAYVFWDSKRPVTVELLGRLDLLALAEELGERDNLLRLRPDLAGATLAKTLF